MNVDITKGKNGVEIGDNGFLSVVNTDNSNGTIIINGFNTDGIGPGESLNIVQVNFNALKQTSDSSTNITLTVKAFTDELASDIDYTDVTEAIIKIIPKPNSNVGNTEDSGGGCFISTSGSINKSN